MIEQNHFCLRRKVHPAPRSHLGHLLALLPSHRFVDERASARRLFSSARQHICALSTPPPPGALRALALHRVLHEHDSCGVGSPGNELLLPSASRAPARPRACRALALSVFSAGVRFSHFRSVDLERSGSESSGGSDLG